MYVLWIFFLHICSSLLIFLGVAFENQGFRSLMKSTLSVFHFTFMTYYLPKAPSINTNILGLGFQHINFGDTQTFSLWHSAPGSSNSCTPQIKNTSISSQ